MMWCVLCIQATDSSWNGNDGEENIDIDRSSSSSASSLDRGGVGVGSGTGGVEHCADGYKLHDRILVLYGKEKTLRTYAAKIVGMEENEKRKDYLVHYNGWNTRYDEWIDSTRIAGRITGAFKSRLHNSTVSRYVDTDN